MISYNRSGQRLLLFFCLILFAGCSATRPAVKPSVVSIPSQEKVKIIIKPGIISGKVTYNNEPLSGAFVYLYRDAGDNFEDKAAYVSEETGVDGSFRIKANPGSYYLIARKGEDNEYYCFYGGNPLLVNPGQVWRVGLSLVKKKTPDAGLLIPGMPHGTGIRGLVLFNGKPLSGAQVMVYLNANSNFKGLGFDQRFTDARGRFIIDLPEGTYYLLVRKRRSGQMAGPLVTGDYYAYYEGNPLVVRDGKYLDAALTCVVKQDRVKDEREGQTIVSGLVVDKEGRPLAGVYVGAYLSSQVMGRPAYVSPLTGNDGLFQLELPKGGKYYLMGRDTYSGPPAPGDLFGWYSGSEDHSIVIETGAKLENLKIIVAPVF